MLKNLIYPIAKYTDMLLDKKVREAIQILDFGENASLDQLSEFRSKAFTDLIHYAYHNVPYYFDVFNSIKLKPGDFKKLEDIEKIPVLTKDDIRKAGKSIQSTKINELNYIISRSGGTTGEPIASYYDRRARALGTYAARRGQMWMGWKPGIPIVLLFGGSLGRPQKNTMRARLRDYSLGTIFLPAFDLKRENANEYLKVITDNSPCIINGYASAIYNLALYAEALNFTTSKVVSVFCTAEYLPDQWAERISTVFKCPVKCYYGCGEIESLGFQVEQFGPYIVPDEHVIIESKQRDDVEKIECDHSLLVTALFNYAQPLIRYQLGDIGEVSVPGSQHPTRSTVYNLIGRTSDMFSKEDGTMISPSLAPHLILKTHLPVKKYQFIQKDFKSIEFLYDPENIDLTESEKSDVMTIIRAQISEKINLKFIKTNDFVLSKNGKMRIVLSEVSAKRPGDTL